MACRTLLRGTQAVALALRSPRLTIRRHSVARTPAAARWFTAPCGSGAVPPASTFRCRCSARRRSDSSRPPRRWLGSSSSSAAAVALPSLRNVGIIAHIDAGKTTTTERFLFYSNRIRHLGDVDRGDTHTDFLPEERRRGITIKAATTSLPWRSHVITLIDTPGHVDFTQEVEGSVRVIDAVILVLDAVKGVQAQTTAVYKQSQRQHTSTIAFVNKMDRPGADLHAAASSVQRRLGKPVAVLQWPLYGQQGELRGVVDLLEEDEVLWEGDDEGVRYERRKVPGGLKDEAVQARERLLETLAEHDDAFMSLFLSSSPPSASDARAAVRRLTLANNIIPVLCGSALRNKGMQLLMDAVIDYAPSPADVRGIRVATAGSRTARAKHHSAKGHGPGGELTVEVSEKGPLLALAFKVTHDTAHGATPLVLVRVYSGVMHAKDVLLNTTANRRRPAQIEGRKGSADTDREIQTSSAEQEVTAVRERALKLLRIDADEQEDVESIRAGCIGAVVGLKHTIAGDTLVRAGEEERILPAIPAPEPVFFASVEAESEAEQKRMVDALECLVREDASLTVTVDAETGQTLLRGQGQLHLELVFHRLTTDFRVKAELGKMRVAYRETVLHEDAMRLYAATQAADALLAISLEPLAAATAVEVEVDGAEALSVAEALAVIAECSSASSAAPPPPPPSSSSLPLLPAQSVALHSALLSSLQRGPLLGYPLLGLRLRLTHYFITPHTTAASLRTCASLLCRQLLRRMAADSGVALLEPMMSVVVTADKADVGYVMTELAAARRGTIGEVEGDAGGREAVHAEVPLTEMMGFADVLRSRTAGTATYSMALHNYAQVPQDVQRKIIAQHR